MWKDLDILTNNIESTNQISGPSLPPQFFNHPTKPPTIIPFVKDIVYSSQVPGGNTFKFLINSTGLLDPYYGFFKITVTNNTVDAIFPSKSNIHLIDRLTISTNGNIIEEYTKFDIINDILLDISLSHEVLDKFRHFGFYKHVPNIILPVNGIDTSLDYPNDNHYDDKSVYNGVPVVCSNNKVHTLYIPFMSRYFGLGQDFNTYKFIPLERLPNLEITITFSAEAFSAMPTDNVFGNAANTAILNRDNIIFCNTVFN